MAHTKIVCYKHNRELTVFGHSDMTKENVEIRVDQCPDCLEDGRTYGYNEGWKAAGEALSKGPLSLQDFK